LHITKIKEIKDIFNENNKRKFFWDNYLSMLKSGEFL